MAATEEECILIARVTSGFMVMAGAAYEVSEKNVKRSVWIMQRPVQGVVACFDLG